MVSSLSGNNKVSLNDLFCCENIFHYYLNERVYTGADQGDLFLYHIDYMGTCLDYKKSAAGLKYVSFYF